MGHCCLHKSCLYCCKWSGWGGCNRECKMQRDFFMLLSPPPCDHQHAQTCRRESQQGEWNPNPMLCRFRVPGSTSALGSRFKPKGLGNLVIQVGLGLWPRKNKLSSGTVAQLVLYLTSGHKALALTPALDEPHVVAHACSLGSWEVEAGGLGFKVICSYISGLMLAGATCHSVSKKTAGHENVYL